MSAAAVLPEDSSTSVLSVRGLTIDLVGRTRQRGLVDDVSFQVGRGKSVALIGESGCGKTITATTRAQASELLEHARLESQPAAPVAKPAKTKTAKAR